jgi:4-aminobutyrate aminotransferase-like enzyme
MIGVEFVADRGTRAPDGATADAVVARAADLGLLVLTCGLEHQVVRWIPPLDVSGAEIAEGLERFGEALRTV